jgi:predicted ribosomally synthesized peptide with nif11-like leader
MSQENLRFFLESLRKDPAIAQKFDGLSTPSEIVAAANALGFELNESDLPALGSEVPLNELDTICGGIIDVDPDA